ncbi:unnamed protein product [Protopolystoma xenopodis]|uniref:Thioredoxin peroxidase n=1 Tax=Protopolystoma xenopodis TaxID=117903 RepID=A0A448XEW8_9PLAT|nr:unnamed protein product [Protopolystoma xenopodis]
MLLQLNKPAPAFTADAVVGNDFKVISLSDYKGKYVVLFFYPLDFTFVCPTEIIAFNDRLEDFKKRGCELLACSTDSKFSHLAWVNTPRKTGGLGPMNIPLLSDKTGRISKAYHVYDEDEGHTLRGLFIIDPKGALRQITVNDRPVGRSVDETIRLIDALQFTDQHGEVCPANWRPGDKTIKPTTDKSKEYFASTDKYSSSPPSACRACPRLAALLCLMFGRLRCLASRKGARCMHRSDRLPSVVVAGAFLYHRLREPLPSPGECR